MWQSWDIVFNWGRFYVIDPLRNAIRIFKSPEKEINIIFIRIY